MLTHLHGLWALPCCRERLRLRLREHVHSSQAGGQASGLGQSSGGGLRYVQGHKKGGVGVFETFGGDQARVQELKGFNGQGAWLGSSNVGRAIATCKGRMSDRHVCGRI